MSVFKMAVLLLAVQGFHGTDTSFLSANFSKKFISDYRQLCPHSDLCHDNGARGELLIGQSCCSACSCDKLCAEWGDCCPDAEPDTFKSSHEVKCVSVYAREISTASLDYFMIQSCAESASGTNSENEQRCLRPKYNVIGENIPVYDSTTKRVYLNKYCALCNGRTDTQPWSAYLTSSVNMFQDSLPDNISDPQTLFWYITNSLEDKVNVAFLPASNMHRNVKQCFRGQIESCNQTGKWAIGPHSDDFSFYRQACGALLAPYWSPSLFVYKNVFCAACNGERIERECFFTGAGMQLQWGFVAIFNYDDVQSDGQRLVLGNRERVYSSSNDCNASTILDPFKKLCQPWYCPMGFYKFQSECRPLFSRASGFTLLFLVNVASKSGNLATSGEHSWTAVGRHVAQTVFQTSKVLSRSNLGSRVLENLVLQQVATYSEGSHQYVFLYTASLEAFEDNSDVYIQTFIQNTLSVKKTRIVSNNNTIILETSSAENILLNSRQYSVFYFPGSIMLKDLRHGCLLENIYVNNRYFVKGTDLIRVTKLLTCKQIEIHKKEYVLKDSDDILQLKGHGTDHMDLKLKLYATQFLKKVRARSVRICFDDYLRLHEIVSRYQSASYSVGRIVTLCLMSVSIVSLSAFIVSHIVIPCQRTRLWKFHLVVGGHILAAQLLYVLSLVFSKNYKPCVILAAGSHFSWLLVIFWYPISCIHIVQALMKSRRGSLPTISTAGSVLVTYTACVYTVCFVFVGSHVLFSLVTTPFADLGYSSWQGICFMTSSKMAVCFLLSPGVVALGLCSACYCKLCLNAEYQESSFRATMIESVSNYTKLCLLTLSSWISWVIFHWLGSSTWHILHVGFNAATGMIFLVCFCSIPRNSPTLSASSASL